MNYRDKLVTMVTEINNQVTFVTKQLEECPPGNIMISEGQDRTRIFWSIRTDGGINRQSINENKELINGLVRKEYLQTLLNTLAHNQTVLRNALQEVSNVDEQTILQLMQPSKRRYLRESAPTNEFNLRLPEDPAMAKKIIDWYNSPFETLDYHNEAKRHKTSQGLLVRSKSEMSIVERFYHFGLAAHYEQIITVDGQKFAPDFTIMRTDGKIFLWEHCGLVNNEKYWNSCKRKLEMYEKIGFVPWDNLIVTYDSPDGTLDMRIVEGEILNKLIL